MSSEASRSNTHVTNRKGETKFIGGAAMARQKARKIGGGSRILRPDEKQRLESSLPPSLSPFERFFAGLLRTPAEQFLQKPKDTWRNICQRFQLPVPDKPLKSSYPDVREHFAYRAALVLEESRYSIAEGVQRMDRERKNRAPPKANQRQHNNNNNGNGNNNMMVILSSTDTREKTGHTILKFHKKSGPFTYDEIFNLRQGSVFACRSRNVAPTLSNATLGCVLPTSRDDMIKERTFSVMVFKPMKLTTPDSGWELTFVTSLLTEHRKFEACTSKKSRLVPFVHNLLGGKGATHTRVEEDESGTSIPVDVIKKDTKNGKAVNPPPNVHAAFSVQKLNKTQELAASAFLDSEPNTITLIQGPPGSGKTSLLVSVICRYISENIREGKARSLMVCAPTNKAVSVLCTRFLETIKGPFPCNVVLVGDDDKLLDDDCSRNRVDGESSKLRSIFLYSWVKTVLDDCHHIKKYLMRNDRRRGDDVLAMARRLQSRLISGLSGLSKDIRESFAKLITWLEHNTATKGGGSSTEPLQILSEVMGKICDWRQDHIWADLLGSAHVIFCTLASAGASVLKKSIVEINDLIVDEAAASSEPEMYIPFFFRPERMLAVGDPKQLPASVASHIAESLGLSKSLHERLMYDCKFEHIMLDVQYRMRPDVSEFPSNRFYDGKLCDGPNVVRSEYKGSVQLLNGQAYSFLQVNGMERRAHSGSYENASEANVIVDLVQQLEKASRNVRGKWHSADRIRIITFYQAQVNLIKRLLGKRRLGNVVVATVDSSQGCEADIVIVSFVRSHSRDGKATVGFLTDDRRMNVAITRSKYQLICVGNAERMATLTDSRAETIKKLACDAKERNCVLPFPNLRTTNERQKRPGQELQPPSNKKLREDPRETVKSNKGIAKPATKTAELPSAKSLPKNNRVVDLTDSDDGENQLPLVKTESEPASSNTCGDKSSVLKEEGKPLRDVHSRSVARGDNVSVLKIEDNSEKELPSDGDRISELKKEPGLERDASAPGGKTSVLKEEEQDVEMDVLPHSTALGDSDSAMKEEPVSEREVFSDSNGFVTPISEVKQESELETEVSSCSTLLRNQVVVVKNETYPERASLEQTDSQQRKFYTREEILSFLDSSSEDESEDRDSSCDELEIVPKSEFIGEHEDSSCAGGNEDTPIEIETCAIEEIFMSRRK